MFKTDILFKMVFKVSNIQLKDSSLSQIVFLILNWLYCQCWGNRFLIFRFLLDCFIDDLFVIDYCLFH